jgi:hypothetical protein
MAAYFSNLASHFVIEPLNPYPTAAICAEILPPLLELSDFHPRIWGQIRNNYWGGKIQLCVQTRLPRDHAFDFSFLKEKVREVLFYINRPCRLQICVASLLQHIPTQDFKFFYGSNNTDLFQNRLPTIRSLHELDAILLTLQGSDTID